MSQITKTDPLAWRMAVRRPAVAVVAALQGWMIIVIPFVILAALVRGRRPPQAGLIRVFLLFLNLVAILNRSQPRLHVGKLRGRNHVLCPCRQDMPDLLP